MQNIDLVKIDTESTEPAVLRGMIANIKKEQTGYFLENHLPWLSTKTDIDAILAPLGYVANILQPRTSRQVRINAALRAIHDRGEGHGHQ